MLKGFHVGLLVAMLGTAGCASTLEHKNHSAISAADSAAAARLSEIRNRQEGFIQEENRIWVGGAPHAIAVEKDLPAVFQKTVFLKRQVPVTLQMVAQFASREAGMPVRVTQDAVDSAALATVDPLSERLAATSAVPGAMLLQYEGSLDGLLDEVAARTANSWRYSDGKVTIFHFDTRTFYISALPGTSTVSTQVSNTSQSGGGAGGMGGGGGGAGGAAGGAATSQTQTQIQSGQTTTMNTEVEVINATAESVQSMLTKGGQMAVMPGASAITVTDVPAVLDRIDRYIENLNERLTRQVAIDVRLYSVQVEDTESFGIDWTTVYQTLSNRYGITTQSYSDAPANAQSLNLSVLDPTSAYSGSQLLVQALATQGSLATRTSASVITLSGQPVPVQVTSETSYVAGSELALAGVAGNPIVTNTLGTITTGFSLTMLPVILDNQDVLLQFTINLSALRGLRSVGQGDSQIEAPNVDSRQFLQRVRMRSGATLVMSGFEQEGHDVQNRGVGSPRFWLAGGGANSSRTHTVLVLVLTPRVV